MPEHFNENEDVRHVPDDLLGKSPAIMTETERIAAALKVAVEYGDYDGDHHKMWTIDQMIRVLTGSPLEKKPLRTDIHGIRYTYDHLGESDAYNAFVADYNDGEDGPDTNEWDTGIAP
jgi:hypothetical protein